MDLLANRTILLDLPCADVNADAFEVTEARLAIIRKVFADSPNMDDEVDLRAVFNAILFNLLGKAPRNTVRVVSERTISARSSLSILLDNYADDS